MREWKSDFARLNPEGKVEKSERGWEQSNFLYFFGLKTIYLLCEN